MIYPNYISHDLYVTMYQKSAHGKSASRGLTPWGKDKDFCNSWIQQAVRFYADVVGPPPVITGVRSSKSKFRRGHTRGQPYLVKAAGS